VLFVQGSHECLNLPLHALGPEKEMLLLLKRVTHTLLREVCNNSCHIPAS
jgi:hypothetical protein